MHFCVGVPSYAEVDMQSSGIYLFIYYKINSMSMNGSVNTYSSKFVAENEFQVVLINAFLQMEVKTGPEFYAPI